MIEIVMDSNKEDSFLSEKRPVIAIKDCPAKDWKTYTDLANQVLQDHKNTPIIIIRCDSPGFSINLFAVALFAQSCLIENSVDCAVFKVADKNTALYAYKPYVALSIGIKYIIRLSKETPLNIRKDITTLNYLGLNIKEDYASGKIFFTLSGTKPSQKISAATIEETLITIGILKSLALAETDASIEAEITIPNTPDSPDIATAIQKIVEYALCFIH